MLNIICAVDLGRDSGDCSQVLLRGSLQYTFISHINTAISAPAAAATGRHVPACPPVTAQQSELYVSA